MELLYLQSIALGFIEGVTEFLPVSSTGHLIVAGHWFGMEESAFTRMFDVVIQLGAILAVVVFFREKLLPRAFFRDPGCRQASYALWLKMAAAVAPAVVIGLLLNDWMEAHLFTPSVVGVALIVGGLLLFGLDRPAAPGRKTIDTLDGIGYGRAVLVGVAQCLAMIPGTSRSAATIIGALCLGFSRPLAVEFSFYLAIPTMFGASLLKVAKHGLELTGSEWLAVGIGFSVSFFVSWAVIAFFMAYIRKHTFSVFAWYRLAFGAFVLFYFSRG